MAGVIAHADTVTMTSPTTSPVTSPVTSHRSDTVGTYACSTCEVTWTSYDSACWMCGRSAATGSIGSTVDPTRPPRTTTSLAAAPAHRPDDILRAHAMGLPDPRYTARTSAPQTQW